MVVKKVNIEMLIGLLLKFRGQGEYVNLHVEPNAIHIQLYESTKINPPNDEDDIENNLNQLLG